MNINKIELARKLADRELRNIWKPYKGNGRYIPIDVQFENDGIIYYTHEAQEAFDKLYDEFIGIILNCKN